jgi:hypothetical protein
VACGNGDNESGGAFGDTGDGGGGGDGSQPDGGGDSDGGGTGDGGNDDGGDGDGDDDGGILYDVDDGTGGGNPEGEEETCQNIDFLFAIDNSNSMSDKQQRLAASAPGFVRAIQDSLDADISVHVGSVTSDAYEHNGECGRLGALVGSRSGEDCGGYFTPGNRFLTEENDLDAGFPCISLVGSGGSSAEKPVTAAVTAVDGMVPDPEFHPVVEECNTGFLRDDAILVVVIISDDIAEAMPDDAHPTYGDAETWKSGLVAAKNGDEDAIVVIGFLAWEDTDCAWGSGGYYENDNVIEFVESFGSRGILGSVCFEDYAEMFADAVAKVTEVCEENPPEG